MKALLELLDQLLFLLERHEHAEAQDPSREALSELLEALAGEAVSLAGALRQQPEPANRDEAPERAELRESLMQRALEAIAHGRYGDAEAILQGALDEFPDQDDYYQHLGLIAWERGDMARAERYYARAASLAMAQLPFEDARWSSPQARATLRALEGQALCLYRMERLDEACDAFELLALTCVPDYQGCHYLAGEIHHLQGRLDRAIASYLRAPTEPAVLYNLALAYLLRGQMEDCVAALLRAFAANPHIAQGLLSRPMTPAAPMRGYLASHAYVAEFLDACQLMWAPHPHAQAMIARCFDHPLVQRHLTSEDPDPELVAAQGLLPELLWGGQPEPSTESLRRVRGLAQQLLEHIVY